MAEKESEHRQATEKAIVNAQIADSKAGRVEARFGQFFGFSIGVVGIVTGAVMCVLGAEWAGSSVSVSTLGGIVYVFVKGRKAESPPANPQS